MPKHLRVKANFSGRDFVIGDLHGMYPQLETKLEGVNFDSTRDRLFSVGDLIDRGEENLRCLNLLKEHWFFCVRGNHEQMLINTILDNDPIAEKIWHFNGGNWATSVDKKQLKTIARQLRKLPWTIEIESPVPDDDPVGICHAEYPLSTWKQRIRTHSDMFYHNLLWSRKQATQRYIRKVSGVQAIYCGHTIFAEPLQLGNCHFIDTGCFQTGRLHIKQLFY
ncbi:metallophosphoesterase [Gynuella sp.]|uniref:metallophosphoesterase n=1 Tax=Gynuella sp. TaxID=2969146 RepID=UPI003D14725B